MQDFHFFLELQSLWTSTIYQSCLRCHSRRFKGISHLGPGEPNKWSKPASLFRQSTRATLIHILHFSQPPIKRTLSVWSLSLCLWNSLSPCISTALVTSAPSSSPTAASTHTTHCYVCFFTPLLKIFMLKLSGELWSQILGKHVTHICCCNSNYKCELTNWTYTVDNPMD